MSANKCVSAGALVVLLVALTGCASSSLTGNSAIEQITPSSAVLSLGQKLQFNALVNVPNASSFLWEVNGVVGGTPATGTITSSGVYTAPTTNTTAQIQISIQSQKPSATVAIFDPSQPTPGVVASTQNPLVASYTVVIPMGASAQVQFGPDTTYGLNTSTVTSETGETATIYVAGMRASTTYHMQAVTTLANGTQINDADHTFQTGAIPTANIPIITTTLTGNGAPSPGIELLSLIQQTDATALSAVATDLAGNVVWYYALNGGYVDPIKTLPNGHMLMLTAGGVTSTGQTTGPSDIREIDLAGNIIYRVTVDQINQSLSSIVPYQCQSLNHDVLKLPNGHYIAIATIIEPVNNVSGVPNGTAVAGNALIDWDPVQGAVAWTWSTFDHLSPSRAPYGISDWTHGNALFYSSSDGNLIFSMRNQNWIVKLNYQDGAGDGTILWRFGPGGDFTLPAGQAPIEWNYGQHDVTIQSPNTDGTFKLMFFNNGNNRLVDSNNDVCGTPGFIACYSSVPIFQVDENTKTANVLWETNLAPRYSVCCGDALILPNNNIEYDIADDVNILDSSTIEEVTQEASPQVIWRMFVQGVIAYRGYRIPSLYPNVTWPAYAQQNARTANSH